MTAMEKEKEPILRIQGISKSFTDTKALDGVSIDIYKGEIHALLGENGAGKSTLIKILCGVYNCTDGSFVYKGENIGLDTGRLSLSVVHQDLGLVDEMSVAENIAQVIGYQKKGMFISWKKTREKVLEVLKKMECGINPDVEVSSLSAAEKSMVAISRALINETDILILDEPTATLPQKDVDKLFQMLRRLKDQGIAIIYVSHRLDEIFEISQKITVLRNGKLVKTALTEEMTPEQLVYDLLGREIETAVSEKAGAVSEEILLELRKVNTGHHEVGRCIWGVEPKDSGEILINGEPVQIREPAEAIRKGIGFVSSKRKEEGMAEELTVRENLYANPYAVLKERFPIIHLKKEQEAGRRVIDAFSIKTPDEEAAIGTLSGGNQQKVMVARWFEARSDILILEEPTIGVDIGAKMDIYKFMGLLLKEGKGVILISSDVEEVCNIAHRVILFDRGGVLGEVTGKKINRTYLNGLATGALKPDA